MQNRSNGDQSSAVYLETVNKNGALDTKKLKYAECIYGGLQEQTIELYILVEVNCMSAFQKLSTFYWTFKALFNIWMETLETDSSWF